MFHNYTDSIGVDHVTIEELQKKVEAAEQKVEKCKKTIERHQAQMEKKGKQLRDLGVDPETADAYRYAQLNTKEGNDIYWLLCDYKSKREDIKGATGKLHDAERILGNWQEKLDLQVNQEKVIQEQVPEIIKVFMEDWKQKTFQWYVKRHAVFVEKKADLQNQVCEARLEALLTLPEYERTRTRLASRFPDLSRATAEDLDYEIRNLYPYQPVDRFLKEKHLDEKSVREKLSWIGDQTIYKMCEFRKEEGRLQWLEQACEAEKKSKMLRLVNEVTAITGPITDAKGLYISAGDLNGTILGEKGAANVQTFSAGGWNIQCFHFRTRVDDVTHKVMGKPSSEKISLDLQILSAKSKIEKSTSDQNKNPPIKQH